MKRIQYIASIALASLLALNLSGCGENNEVLDTDGRGIEIEGVSVTMEGMSSEANASTRAAQTQDGFSVNKEGTDPTYARPEARDGWKMDFTVYNANAEYSDGSFTGATYSNSKWASAEQKYFPNYTKPQAEVYIYPSTKDAEVATDQSGNDNLLSQDILFRAKGVIEVAHIPAVTVKHKRSMLNFVIKDVVRTDINEVKVLISTTEYTPCKVSTETTGTGDIEYMLILPETTNVNPVVQIKTKSATTDNTIQTITYKQTINIIKDNSKDNLGSNKCYCFTLQGADLKISPVTVLNWASGESLPGEYIAVTAYPTFKGRPEDANKTYYFYYDNKLMENGKPKLQEITFNQNAECTIKPDGRILTHIYNDNQVENIENSANKTPSEGENGKEVSIILSQMIIDLTSVMSNLKQ